MEENAKINVVLNIRKQLPVSLENIRMQVNSNNFWTPHVIRSMLIPSITKSELVWLSYSLCKITVSCLLKAFYIDQVSTS